MSRIKESYLLLLIVIGLVSLSLYSTYALFTTSTTINNVVSFNATLTTDSNILEYEMVTVPAGETKIIELSITNSYGSTLYYGAWYEVVSASDTSKVFVGLYTEENSNPSSGTLSSGSSITLLVGIRNSGTTEATVNVGTVGSLTSSLGLSSNRNLLPSGWEPIFTLANKVIKLSSTDACAADTSGVCATNSYTASDGSTKYHDYRYRGGEGVNNFVWFNNELYRIIGVFDENSHGVEGEYLVKLIRSRTIGSYAWGAYNTTATSGTYSSHKNDWTGNTIGVKPNLNVLLNEYFYKKTSTSTTYGACSNWTYFSSTNY